MLAVISCVVVKNRAVIIHPAFLYQISPCAKLIGLSVYLVVAVYQHLSICLRIVGGHRDSSCIGIYIGDIKPACLKPAVFIKIIPLLLLSNQPTFPIIQTIFIKIIGVAIHLPPAVPDDVPIPGCKIPVRILLTGAVDSSNGKPAAFLHRAVLTDIVAFSLQIQPGLSGRIGSSIKVIQLSADFLPAVIKKSSILIGIIPGQIGLILCIQPLDAEPAARLLACLCSNIIFISINRNHTIPNGIAAGIKIVFMTIYGKPAVSVNASVFSGIVPGCRRLYMGLLRRRGYGKPLIFQLNPVFVYIVAFS